MDERLSDAAARLGIDLPNLAVAAEKSAEQRQRAEGFLVERLGSDPSRLLDVVVCGSMARQEMSGISDFDYLVVAHGLVDDIELYRGVRQACSDWCDQEAIEKPGSSNLFGELLSAPELVERIGLQSDTNMSLTRRILLLGEGVSLLAPDLHRRFVEITIARYLYGERGRVDVPQFLFNDVARYWRTVAVDYEAKVWQRLDRRGWAVRYLKLRVSRKLAFAGAIVPLFLTELNGIDDREAFLVEQYIEIVPLGRLAQLAETLAGDDAACECLGRILVAADEFSAALADKEHRDRLDELDGTPSDTTDEVFTMLHDLSTNLQSDLERLFLDSSSLGPLGRKFLTF